MEIITTLLIALPLGFFIRHRLVAYLAYVAIHGYVFSLQSTQLMREWVGGSTEAFSKNPDTIPCFSTGQRSRNEGGRRARNGGSMSVVRKTSVDVRSVRY